jgi:hypothetical protein
MPPLNVVIQMLREGKAQLRQERMSGSLKDKVQAVLKAQRMYVEIAGSQRPLPPSQRPWNITP